VSGVLTLRNHQRELRVNLPVLRQITRALLRDYVQRDYLELGIHLLSDADMVRLNETFLRHQGSTDVITFDYGEPAQPGLLCGEIFICIEEAIAQARRFHTTWQSELIRYLVHGLLHLCGYDDRTAVMRRAMKAEENRLLALLTRRFSFTELALKRVRESRRRQGRVESRL